MSANEDWVDKLVQDLNLGDTIAPDRGSPPRDGQVMGLPEILRTVDFTEKGWAAARAHLHAEFAKAPAGLFQSIVDASPDDFKMFLAMIQAAYLLAKTLRYNDEASERLGVFFAMSYTVAIWRGYQKGKADGQALETP